MKYGLTRHVNCHSITRGVEASVVSPAGDYIKASMWCKRHLPEFGDGLDGLFDLYQSYAWAWFALKRTGKLAELGLPEELTFEALEGMTDEVTVWLEEVEEGSLPLTGTGTAQGK